jgi:DNA polymerase I-like protein with 3'-5' exonuclease and polymerase domains
MGPQALGKELNMDPLQAYQLSETFFKSFPGVKQWQEVRVYHGLHGY